MFLDTALVGGWAHFHLLYRLILHKGGSGKCKRVTHLAPGHLNTGILLHEHHLAQGYRRGGCCALGIWQEGRVCNYVWVCEGGVREVICKHIACCVRGWTNVHQSPEASRGRGFYLDTAFIMMTMKISWYIWLLLSVLHTLQVMNISGSCFVCSCVLTFPVFCFW